MIPVSDNTFILGEDKQYGLKTGTFVVDMSWCGLGCIVCRYRGQFSRRISDDDFIKQLCRYRVLGVELFELRGGEPTSLVVEVEQALDVMRNFGIVRLFTNGLRPSMVERMKCRVGGFCLDVKIPLKKSYVAAEKETFQMLMTNVTTVYSYRDAMEASLQVAEGMQFSYLTCSTWNILSQDHRQEVLSIATRTKMPLIVGDSQAVIVEVCESGVTIRKGVLNGLS